jgi:hypothetical protein
VQVAGEEEDASIRLRARVNKADGKIGFFNNNSNSPIHSSDWKDYTIEGTIDRALTTLVPADIQVVLSVK